MKTKNKKLTPDGVGESTPTPPEFRVYLGTIFTKNPNGEIKVPIWAPRPETALGLLHAFAKLNNLSTDIHVSESFILDEALIEYMTEKLNKPTDE